MTDNRLPSIPLEADQKSAQVMAYTQNYLVLGDVVVKSQIRVSTWLRTNAAPDALCLYNAKVITSIAANESLKPLQFAEIHLPTQQIVAFHLVPPAKDPLDYDPSEPNRKMDPVSILTGAFKIDGYMRMSQKSTLAKYLEVTRENFTAIYDAEVRSHHISAMGVIQVPFVLVRQNSVFFALRS